MICISTRLKTSSLMRLDMPMNHQKRRTSQKPIKSTQAYLQNKLMKLLLLDLTPTTTNIIQGTCTSHWKTLTFSRWGQWFPLDWQNWQSILASNISPLSYLCIALIVIDVNRKIINICIPLTVAIWRCSLYRNIPMCQ